MKKQKLGLSKLSLTKSRVAELNKSNVVGGGESTNPQCIFTGVIDGCNVTANGCNTNGCGSNNCTNNNCGPNTREIITCYYAC